MNKLLAEIFFVARKFPGNHLSWESPEPNHTAPICPTYKSESRDSFFRNAQSANVLEPHFFAMYFIVPRFKIHVL